jgi:hypothetical protein
VGSNPTPGTNMSFLIERRLRRMSTQLQQARSELAAAEEQLLQVREESEDAHLRGLVSDQIEDSMAARDSSRYLLAMQRGRDDSVARVLRLEAETDRLLERLNASRK